MQKRGRGRRFFSGLGVVLVVLLTGFVIICSIIPTWGSTKKELGMSLPGDRLISDPFWSWEHAILIKAPPTRVWPWIIQIGDTRGGYYSFRTIEKGFTAVTGSDSSTLYNNVNQIHAEWQTPRIGQGMIADYMVLSEYRNDYYLLATTTKKMGDMQLTWLWYLNPTEDGLTRLLVHIRMQVPNGENQWLAKNALHAATFMMERKMMLGIKLRAEGGSEPDWYEPVEIGAGVFALLMGLVAAWRFVTAEDWKKPLLVGLAAIASIFIMVYIQPPLVLRVFIDLVLLLGIAWMGLQHSQTTPEQQKSA